MSTPRIAIFASGNGTTAEAVIRAAAEGKLDADIRVVISNRETPGVFERVRTCNKEFGMSIDTSYISSKDFPPAANESWKPGQQTKAEEQAIISELARHSIDVVLLLGYLKLVSPTIVNKYGYRAEHSSPYEASMVNTHPGILPGAKGLYGIHVQEHVLQHGLPAGHCVFAVDAEYDGGPVVAEHRVEVLPNDTPETLFARVQDSERATLASDIGTFLRKRDEVTRGENHEK